MRQKKDRQPVPSQDDDDPTESSKQDRQRRETLDDETGEILEEIDEVLEDNAQEFVRSYVQKGGQ